MKINKSNLSLRGMILGFVHLGLFVLMLVFLGALGHVFTILLSLTWAMCLVIGVLMVLDWNFKHQNDDTIYLICGIFMIFFPIISSIVLLIKYEN